MPADARRAATVVATETAKRTVRSAVVWAALFGLLIANEALSYGSNFPTAESRESFANTVGSNSGLVAIVGPARSVDEIGGFVAWRVLWLVATLGEIWALLLTTRMLRGEEESGRWELLLSGRTARSHATAQVLAGLAAGWATLWAVTSAVTVWAGTRPGVGFTASASLLYSTAATAGAAMFIGIAAVVSQLATTRRQANGLGALVFALCYLIRLVADSSDRLGWMRWATPIGWVENLHPLTGSQPVALVPIALLVIAALAVAVALAGRRDLGSALLASSRPPSASTRLLEGAHILVAQLERWTALAWVVGLGGLALVFGVTARAAASGNVAVDTIQSQLGRLGARPATAVEAWIGYEFLFVAAIVAFAAAGQIAAVRNEEAEGRLDNLLARKVNRASWLATRLAFGTVMLIAIGITVGIAGWLGVARHGGVGLGAMLQAGLNVSVAGLFILGLGGLLYGTVPRLAMPLLYLVVLWSFLVEIIGSSLTSNHWLLDTAISTHLGPVPAARLHWAAIATLVGLALLCGLVGAAAYTRRDLVSS